MATTKELCKTLARAIALDDTDLVIDLSGVEFMDASTAGVIIRAQNFLMLRSRSLVLRSPPPTARRVLVICGLADLIEAERDEARPATGTGALSTWVEVPATGRADHRDDPTSPPPSGLEPEDDSIRATAGRRDP